MIVTDERVARFVSDAIGFGLYPPYTCLGIERDGAITAGVIFHCFEGTGIHATVAGHGWTRGFLADVGQYVFGQLGCERITATTEQEDVIKLGLRLGGKVEGCLRNQFGKGRDATIIGILKDDYPY